MRHIQREWNRIPLKLVPQRKRRSVRVAWDNRARTLICYYPSGIPEKTLNDFFEAREEKILALCRKGFSPADNASLIYQGEKYTLSIVDSQDNEGITLDKTRGKIIMKSEDGADSFFKLWNEFLKKEAPCYFEKLIKEAESKTGLKADRWRFRPMRSRWGSASSERAVTLNTLLLMAPEIVSAYVILHELTHFRIPDHSSAFWAAVGKEMADYSLHRRWLREKGRDLLSFY